jgi:arylsulfatase
MLVMTRVESRSAKIWRYAQVLAARQAPAGLAAAFSHAGEVTGDPGSPGATITISGKQLPAPAPDFGGVMWHGAWRSSRLASPLSLTSAT